MIRSLLVLTIYHSSISCFCQKNEGSRGIGRITIGFAAVKKSDLSFLKRYSLDVSCSETPTPASDHPMGN